MDALAKDLRYAAHSLLNARGFTIVAVLTLALGIGVTTAMFTVVNGVLLRPLPYAEPERLMAVNNFNTAEPKPDIAEGPLSFPDYLDVASRNRSFEAVAAYTYSEFTITGLGDPVHVTAEQITSSLFQVLRVKAAKGRAFLSEDDQAGHHVLIVSDRFWRTHLGGQDSAIGRTLALNGFSYTVVGVMPPGFEFSPRSQPRDLWTTFSRWHESDDPKDKAVSQLRGNHSIFAIARLKPGVSIEAANSDLESISRSLANEYPDTNLHEGIAGHSELTYLIGSTRKPMLILLGAVALVLLIACANVANLLLTRGAARAREIAVRTALGATRMRIVRQLVTESVLLSFAGAALGTAFAGWALSGAMQLYPKNLPRAAEIGIDLRVLLFTAGLAIVTGVIFGLVPALRVSSPNVTETMRERGGSGATVSHHRLRSALVIAQTALGVMLLIGAGLLIRSLERLSHSDLGLNPSHVLTANLDLSETRYKPDQMDQFVLQLMERLRAMPGVASAGGAMPLPLGGEDGWEISFNLLDHPLPKANQPSAGFYVVTNGFFETMQIPLKQGRLFDARDQRNAPPVMIVTEAFAHEFFPHEDPIGRRVEIGAGEGEARRQYKTREIVGVVGNIRSSNITAKPVPAYYIPLSQLMWGPPTLVVRTTGSPQAMVPAISKVLASMDPDTPLYNVRTVEDCLTMDLGRARFQTVLLTVFAAIALLLTAIGLYGLIAYSVVQRTHEIGIRMALGASRENVMSMMLNRGLQLTVAGVVVGLAGALAFARIIEALLYEIPPRDPVTYVVVSIALTLVALLASGIPAIRATRIDPMVALRYE